MDDSCADHEEKNGLLHRVAKSGNVDMMKHLLRKKPFFTALDLSTPNFVGRNCLHIAVAKRCIDMVRFCSYYVGVDATDQVGVVFFVCRLSCCLLSC